MQVIGVAKMSKHENLPETLKPFFFVPMHQSAMGRALHMSGLTLTKSPGQLTNTAVPWRDGVAVVTRALLISDRSLARPTDRL